MTGVRAEATASSRLTPQSSRWAAEPVAITRANAECRLSIDVALGGTAASLGLVVAGASPGASRPTSVAACRRLVEAVSTHCMALGRAASGDGVPIVRRFLRESPEGGLPEFLDAAGRSTTGGRSHIGPPPSGRFEQVFNACGLGAGVEPATARFTVWCSTH